jgi:SAM-dependent methyltransferase
MNIFLSRIKKFGAVYGKFKFYLPYSVGLSPKTILDIGIANDSYLECKLIYPAANYHGLDCYDDGVEMRGSDEFFLCDLEQLDALKNLKGSYDLIIVNHVLEHLFRGADVFSELCNLLTPNGVLYAEFPSIRTAYGRKRLGSYHFHDDPTHKRFYDLNDLANKAMENGCAIISCGPASTLLKNILSIPRAFFKIVRGKEWGANLLHISGKIDHIAVRKISES